MLVMIIIPVFTKMKHQAVLIILFVYGGLTKEIEEELDTAATIAYYGYPVEKHLVTTPDGYINEVQRIPQGRDTRKIDGCSKRPVVLFMHGLFGSSYEFVLNLPSQSPAFIFADAGFDVWLGNVRGTTYGRNHTHLNSADHHFWNFSFYDFAHSDLASQVEYILEKTGQDSLNYVGHSQGTTIMFARLAESEPKWQEKVRTFFVLGPSAGFVVPDLPLDLLEIGVLQRLIQFVLDGKFGILPLNLPPFINTILARVCGQHVLTHICVSAFYLPQGGETISQLNETRVPIIVKHFPDSTSTLNLLHWAQIFKYHEIRRLDLGTTRNLEVYGQTDAPRLDLSNIEVPTYLYYSEDDHITDQRDVNEVIIKHMGPALKKAIKLKNFSHYDYAAGLQANDDIFKPIIYDIYDDIEQNGCY